jgi:hypothetical protein
MEHSPAFYRFVLWYYALWHVKVVAFKPY